MRRGEILALQWNDLNMRTGELHISRQVYPVRGELQVSTPKTKSSVRTVVLPPSLTEVLKEYKKTVNTRWMFPSPVKEDSPRFPGAVRKRLHLILERAGCKKVRFHDLRPPWHWNTAWISKRSLPSSVTYRQQPRWIFVAISPTPCSNRRRSTSTATSAKQTLKCLGRKTHSRR